MLDVRPPPARPHVTLLVRNKRPPNRVFVGFGPKLSLSLTRPVGARTLYPRFSHVGNSGPYNTTLLTDGRGGRDPPAAEGRREQAASAPTDWSHRSGQQAFAMIELDGRRSDLRDGAASAVVPEPKRALSHNADVTNSHVGRRSDVGRPPGRGVRQARAAAVRPCVDAARGDRRDGAASAVVLEPKRDLRRRSARAVTSEAATAESRRAESVAARRQSDVGRPPGREMRRARAKHNFMKLTFH